jgi:hypothetical protein
MLDDFKKPDVKAPRHRPTGLNILNKELYDKFIEKYPEHKEHGYEQFKKIIYTFNEALWKEAVENRDGVELPESLGNLFIGTCWRTKRKNINFGRSAEYEKTLTNQNHETDGKVCKIFYTNYNNKYRFVNRVMWTFQGCRDFKRTLAKHYPENWKKYIHIDPNLRINKLYKKKIQRDYMQAQAKRMEKFYNEFDMD